MKNKLPKFLSMSLIISILAIAVLTTFSDTDIQGPYGQAVPTYNQIVSV